MTLAAVLFDWGGTLTPMHAADLYDLWRAAAAHLAPDRVDEIAAELTKAEQRWWDDAVAGRRSGSTADLLKEVAASSGLDVAEAVHELALDAHHRQWAPYTVAKPEAVDVLMQLRARGLRTGLLSNTHWTRRWHEGFLERDGLLHLLDARVYTSDLSHLKPAPEAFVALLDAVGVAPEESVFVGDRLYDDIYGAGRVGMRTVWIANDATPSYDVTPDVTINAITELVDAIADWRD